MFFYLYSLFFYRYGAHRDLHSFPTRRSSDLVADTEAFRLLDDRGLVTDERDIERRVRLAERFQRRSEEHTSELQSHSELVCRLLLEKKNRLATESLTLAKAHPGKCDHEHQGT